MWDGIAIDDSPIAPEFVMLLVPLQFQTPTNPVGSPRDMVQYLTLDWG
jgi:hypothetical protein